MGWQVIGDYKQATWGRFNIAEHQPQSSVRPRYRGSRINFHYIHIINWHRCCLSVSYRNSLCSVCTVHILEHPNPNACTVHLCIALGWLRDPRPMAIYAFIAFTGPHCYCRRWCRTVSLAMRWPIIATYLTICLLVVSRAFLYQIALFHERKNMLILEPFYAVLRNTASWPSSLLVFIQRCVVLNR